MLISIVLIVILSGLFYYFTKIKLLYAYLISINLMTLLFYGYDKNQAKNNKSRIPEVVLHLLALIGGSLGALIGQFYFRHKTKKLKFQMIYVMIVIFQIGLIIYWLTGDGDI